VESSNKLKDGQGMSEGKGNSTNPAAVTARGYDAPAIDQEAPAKPPLFRRPPGGRSKRSR
jgi:hypothetical protein